MRIKRTVKKCQNGIVFIDRTLYKSRGQKRKRAARMYKTTERQQKINAMRAERKLLEMLHNNFSNGISVTLTFENMPEDLRKEAENFIRRLRYRYNALGEKLQYMLAPEYKDHRPHLHVVINENSDMTDLNKRELEKYIEKIWKRGEVDARRLERNGYYKNLADYMIKETSETFNTCARIFGTRCTHSKGLEPPQAETEIINGDFNDLLNVPDTEIIDGEEYEKIEESEYIGKNPFNGSYYVTYALKPTARTLQARRQGERIRI